MVAAGVGNAIRTVSPVTGLTVTLDMMPSIAYIVPSMRNIPPPPRRLANRLRVARAERGWSQDDLARRAGVTRQTVSSIETGQYGPSALLAFVLAEQLGRRVDELFHLEPIAPDAGEGGSSHVDP